MIRITPAPNDGGIAGTFIAGETFVIRNPVGATEDRVLRALDFRGRHLRYTYNATNAPDDENIFATGQVQMMVLGDAPTGSTTLISSATVVYIDTATGFLRCKPFTSPNPSLEGITLVLEWTDADTGMSTPTVTLT